MSNYKSKLFELCMKNSLSMPIYEYDKIGLDHKPSFKSILKLGEHMVESSYCASKSLADQESSKLMLDKLTSTVDNYILEPHSIKIIIMIDGENIHSIPNYTSNTQIYYYVSKLSPLVNKDLPSYIIKCISPSTRSDGCDIYMTMDIMNMPYRYPNLEKIYIVSRDKFAGCVVDNFPAFFRNITIEQII
jgi:hypothetical protein